MPRSAIAQNKSMNIDTIITQISDTLKGSQKEDNFYLFYDSMRNVFNSNSDDIKNIVDRILISPLNDCVNELKNIEKKNLSSSFAIFYDGYQHISRIIQELCGRQDISDSIKTSFKDTLDKAKIIPKIIRAICDEIQKARKDVGNVDFNCISKITQIIYDDENYTTKFIEQMESSLSDEEFTEQINDNDLTKHLSKWQKQVSNDEFILREICRNKDHIKNLLGLSVECFYKYFEDDEKVKAFSAFLGMNPNVIITKVEVKAIQYITNISQTCGIEFNLFEGYKKLRNSCLTYLKDSIKPIETKLLSKANDDDTISKLLNKYIRETEKLSQNYLLIFQLPEAEELLEKSIRDFWNTPDLDIPIKLNILLNDSIQTTFNVQHVYKDRTPFATTIAKFYNRIDDVIKRHVFEMEYERSVINRLITYGPDTIYVDKPIIDAIRKPDNKDFLKKFNSYIENIVESRKIDKKLRINDSYPGINPVSVFQLTEYFEKLNPLGPECVPDIIKDFDQNFHDMYQSEHQNQEICIVNDKSSIILSLEFMRNGAPFSCRINTSPLRAKLIQLIIEKPRTKDEIINILCQQEQKNDELQTTHQGSNQSSERDYRMNRDSLISTSLDKLVTKNLLKQQSIDGQIVYSINRNCPSVINN